MQISPLITGIIVALDEELDYILEELGGDYETELSQVTGANYLVYKPIFDSSRYSPRSYALTESIK